MPPRLPSAVRAARIAGWLGSLRLTLVEKLAAFRAPLADADEPKADATATLTHGPTPPPMMGSESGCAKWCGPTVGAPPPKAKTKWCAAYCCYCYYYYYYYYYYCYRSTRRSKDRCRGGAVLLRS